MAKEPHIARQWLARPAAASQSWIPKDLFILVNRLIQLKKSELFNYKKKNQNENRTRKPHEGGIGWTQGKGRVDRVRNDHVYGRSDVGINKNGQRDYRWANSTTNFAHV